MGVEDDEEIELWWCDGRCNLIDLELQLEALINGGLMRFEWGLRRLGNEFGRALLG